MNSSIEVFKAFQVTVKQLQSGQLSAKDLFETMQTKLAKHSEPLHKNVDGMVDGGFGSLGARTHFDSLIGWG